MENQREKVIPIYIVSGGKGIAGHTMVHSILIQYPDNKIPVNIIPEVQTVERIENAVWLVKENNGLICHTMVNKKLRKVLIETCEKYGVKEIDFMGDLAEYLENELKMKSISVPGLYRRTNAQYFNRIEAIEYTLNHDDGLNHNRLGQAEIILTGVSRSGKTPLSVYMSMFGWKVANVPIVAGIQPPDGLFKVDPKRVFALTISVRDLIAQRTKRLASIGEFPNKTYVDESFVTNEIRYANLIFEKGGFTKINVTNKPVETTANEIIGFISDRFGHQDRRYKSFKDNDSPITGF